MSDRFEQLDRGNSLVRAIHTAVKGRARYKIAGLYQQKALKRYLELGLSQEETIASVKANDWTGGSDMEVVVRFKSLPVLHCSRE